MAVVGAGLAGLVAARELSHRGHAVVLLEARDRIGGRAWTESRLGRDLELGGSWIHWLQPHIWSEVTRCGLEIFRSPMHTKAIWLVDGERKEGSVPEYIGVVDDGNTRLVEEAPRYFPRPYEPLAGEDLEAIDGQSFADRIEQLDLPREQHQQVGAYWGLFCNGPLSEVAYDNALRWIAVSGNSWLLNFEATVFYKLRAGTSALTAAIQRDAGAELRLAEPVTAISHGDSGVVLRTRGGVEVAARTAIVTLPLRALDDLEFQPELSPAKRAATEVGQATRGFKFWIRLSGSVEEPFIALGEPGTTLAFAQLEYEVDGDAILVAYGPDASRIDFEDRADVEDELRRWLPGAEVKECSGHDWVGDEFSKETWSMLRPGQLTGALSDLRRPEGNILFAGAHLAAGWPGCMDGAIETGISAARDATRHLAA